ncbi:hypothetical protein GCM10017786_59130 [Amycolatopsis deserti]|uniref:Uncharacterized protein n=1 Tax=Amycolatopsis deserti TaxID=185696 RepID=A0ABQ3JF40_9PSEU|nr:hypothetical protein GCM10017786_59130 [Amycolatopsis deserti]
MPAADAHDPRPHAATTAEVRSGKAPPVVEDRAGSGCTRPQAARCDNGRAHHKGLEYRARPNKGRVRQARAGP